MQRRQWHPTPVLLPGKSHGWRSLVGCSPWGREESDTTERLHFHFSLSCIGEGNGNPLQCSCLENPRDGGAWWLPSMGSHRVGHDWSDLAAVAAAVLCMGLPQCLSSKQCACSAQDTGEAVWSLGQENLLEEVMATHSSILAWKIPWTEEPTVHGFAKSQTWLKWLNTHECYVCNLE